MLTNQTKTHCFYFLDNKRWYKKNFKQKLWKKPKNAFMVKKKKPSKHKIQEIIYLT